MAPLTLNACVNGCKISSYMYAVSYTHVIGTCTADAALTSEDTSVNENNTRMLVVLEVVVIHAVGLLQGSRHVIGAAVYLQRTLS
jgi:hypothetical protein